MTLCHWKHQRHVFNGKYVRFDFSCSLAVELNNWYLACNRTTLQTYVLCNLLNVHHIESENTIYNTERNGHTQG